MNNFILNSNTAQIIDNLPSVSEIFCDSSIINKFSHIREFGKLKMKNIVPGSLDLHLNTGIEICYVRKGKYRWIVENKTFDLYPGDCFFTCPWQKHGSPQGVLDIGSLNWIIISPEIFSSDKGLKLGKWSSLSAHESAEIARMFLNSNSSNAFRAKKMGQLFDELEYEIFNQDIGYVTRVNSLLDELLVLTTRALKKQIARKSENLNNDKMAKINDFFQNQLNRNWKTKELAELLNIGQTTLNNLINQETGLSPHQYLVQLRVEASQNLLKKPDKSITDIAFECGFYSSQHFANIFKSRTGFTPSEYRKLS